MTDKEFVLDTMRRNGQAAATALQAESPNMTGTELYAREQYIPDFAAAVAQKNMLERAVGFVCRSSAGRVVRLIPNDDSTRDTGEPEELPAQWRFVWSTDPLKALPFIALSASPYATGDCCTETGHVYRSTIDNNVWAPSAYPAGWEDLGTLEDVEAGTAPEEPTTEPEEPTTEPEPTPEPEPEPDEPEEPTTYPDFVQPTGARDAYSKGDIVMYNGKAYISTIDNNVWSPDAYPQGWDIYTE